MAGESELHLDLTQKLKNNFLLLKKHIMKTIQRITLTLFIAVMLIASLIGIKASRSTIRDFKSCLKENTRSNYSKLINEYIN